LINLLKKSSGAYEWDEAWRTPNSLRDSNVSPKEKTTEE
jgi:hypothetical protein